MASYLTPIQVSVRTGIPKNTLAQWRKDGRGPIFVKCGGRIEYRLCPRVDRRTKPKSASYRNCLGPWYASHPQRRRRAELIAKKLSPNFKPERKPRICRKTGPLGPLTNKIDFCT